jgi:glycosyltransferase involved in cell wall biosynthesis
MKNIVLFHRDFRAFTGGHLKVWDYFNHVAASPEHESRIAFTADSKWDATNPWFGSRSSPTKWEPEKAHLLFLAGTDWRALATADRAKFSKPIINLIQHPRHAEPGSELRSFLKHRAVRICVSGEVAEAINETGEVNGPVFVIPNGIDWQAIPRPPDMRKIDIFISGFKAPELAKEVDAALKGKVPNTLCLTDRLPRPEYLAHLSSAKIAVVLPRPREGFFLPALEAMACDTIVVCPDCMGNRGFCENEVNCFRPSYDRDAIVSSAIAASRLTENERTNMREHAQATIRQHSLETERASFLKILAQIDDLFARDDLKFY